MPTCQNCHRNWTWKQTIKSIFTLDSAMPCPYCEKRQFQTRKSKKRLGLLNLLVLLPLLLNVFLNIPVLILLSLFPLLFILIMSFNPFLMQLSNEEEHIDLL